MQELSTSTNRFGDYILHDRIGAGGMAEIFLATATGIEGFEKRVVIKRILPSLSDDEQFVRMFIEEAKLCVALRHPNIVQVHDLGEIEAQYYIAMEYVDGRDLLKTLAACGKKKIGFPTDIALFIVMEALKGLNYAHQLKKPNGEPLGIIHRDVSPSNVLLSFEGEVKIGDFGIAKANTREKTATGILKGKFGYMAPEQVTGVPIDSRADIFAVGIVMYELLTGHRLFAGKNDLAVLEKVRDARIEPPPRFYRQDLDPELEHIVLRALSRDARDRFQNAHQLHDAIHDYVYRSRATVGPAHLARFMQTLFLNDPEEIDRRSRVKLPLPRQFPVGAASANGARPTAKNGTSNGRVLELLSTDGEFDEKTPLLDPADLPGSQLSSSVAFISDVDSWERAGSSALIDYALAENSDPEPSDRPRPPPLPPLTQAPRIESNRLEPGPERTARTDVEIEVEPPSISIDDSDRSPQARVAALRLAVQTEAPTDLNLSEESKLLIEDRKAPIRPAATVLGRPPTPERQTSGVTDEIADSGPQFRRVELDEDAEDTTRKDDDDDYHDPSDIVERTVSNPGHDDTNLDPDEEMTSEVEPTVRFDSALFPVERLIEPAASTTSIGLFSEERTKEEEGSGNPFAYLSLNDTSGGTLQLEDSDFPTAEVSEAALRADSKGRSEVDTVPAPTTLDRIASRAASENQTRQLAHGRLRRCPGGAGLAHLGRGGSARSHRERPGSAVRRGEAAERLHLQRSYGGARPAGGRRLDPAHAACGRGDAARAAGQPDGERAGEGGGARTVAATAHHLATPSPAPDARRGRGRAEARAQPVAAGAPPAKRYRDAGAVGRESDPASTQLAASDRAGEGAERLGLLVGSDGGGVPRRRRDPERRDGG